MDTKLKRIFIITALLISSTIGMARSQVFRLKTFTNYEAVFQLSLDDVKRTLSISFAKDTVHLRNVDDIKVAKVLNKNFLMIVYGVHSGSGMHLTQTIILSANKNRICQSLNITSLFSEEYLDFDKQDTSAIKVEVKSNYTVELSLIGDNTNAYKLSANVHDVRISKDSTTNHNITDVASLNFDQSRCVFYNVNEDVIGYFTIFDPKTQEEVRKYIKGNFAAIKLGTYKYYYIGNTWYERSDNNYLTKYSYK